MKYVVKIAVAVLTAIISIISLLTTWVVFSVEEARVEVMGLGDWLYSQLPRAPEVDTWFPNTEEIWPDSEQEHARVFDFETKSLLIGLVLGTVVQFLISCALSPIAVWRRRKLIGEHINGTAGCIMGVRKMLLDALSNLEMNVLPGLSNVRAAAFLPEGLMEGSKLSKTQTKRDGQVAFMSDGLVMGFGHIISDSSSHYLIVPEHVSTGSTTIRGPGADVQTSSLIFEDLTEDCVYTMLSAETYYRLGAKSAKIASCPTGALLTFSTVFLNGVEAMKSMGITGDSPFGTMAYYGSTQPGCSGGGYYFGNKLVGLHLGEYTIKGSRYNMGYSFSFLRAVMRLSGNFGPTKQENTDDYVQALAKRTGKTWKAHMYSPGELILKSPVGNEYLTVDPDSVDWEYVQYVDDLSEREVKSVHFESVKYVDQAVNEGLMRPVEKLPEQQQLTGQLLVDILEKNDESDVNPFEPAEVVDAVSKAVDELRKALAEEKKVLAVKANAPNPAKPRIPEELEQLIREKKTVNERIAEVNQRYDADLRDFRQDHLAVKLMREESQVGLRQIQEVLKNLQDAGVNLTTETAKKASRRQNKKNRIQDTQDIVDGLKRQVAELEARQALTEDQS